MVADANARAHVRSWRVFSFLFATSLAACSDTTTPGTRPTYPGTDTLGQPPVAAAFTQMNTDARTIQVAVSSEGFGQRGFDYNATPAEGDIVFVDGWEVRFSRILVTVKNVRLNRPGTMPTVQTSVGALVAQNPRAYAVNVQKAGPLTGAGGGEETAIPLFVFRSGDDGSALDPTVRYAISYDIVPATMSSTNVNLDGEDYTAYQTMINRGWTQLVEGTATYRGTAPAMGTAFASYPTTVRFSLGYGAAAEYLNCYNPDNGGKETPGVQPNAGRAVRAQLTFHMDHIFWESLGAEDPPLHFDPFAARAMTMGTMGVVTMDDLMGVVPSNLRDRMMRQVPDRGGQTRGYTVRSPDALSYSTGGVQGVNDLRDFVVYSARASGHLNADGLCAVRPSGAFRF